MVKEKLFTPVKNREPISKIIAFQIEKAILTKKFLPGSKISSELQMCKEFNVSRSSVREAIRSLTSQGLLKVIKGKGIFVNEISIESVTYPLHKYLTLKLEREYVLDVVRARQMIEPGVAYYAAINYSDEDMILLKNDIRDLKNCKGGYSELAKLDTLFHMHLAKASKSLILPILLEPIHKLNPDIKSFVYANVNDAKKMAVLWHKKIYDAVIKRNADKARKTMQEHLIIAEKHAELMLKAIKSKIKT
jgi:GntR family transcriptional repressor for pyruvate dehydrogenase complex